MNGACNSKFFFDPPRGALGRGQKVKYNLISITKSISKIFIPKFVFVLTNERYKTYQTGFLILSPESCPRGQTLGRWGVPRGSKFFFKHVHVAYQIDRDDEQNRMQVKFSSSSETGDLGVRSNIIEFWWTCQFQRFLHQT